MPLSSRKMRRLKSTLASSARHTFRAWASSGRSCSAARRLFFAPQAQLLEPPAHGRQARLHPGTLIELLRVLGQRPVVALGHEILERVQRRLIKARDRTPRMRSRLPPPLALPRLLPAIKGALPHAEQPRKRGPAQPTPRAGPQHPIPQLSRVSSRHGVSLRHTTAQRLPATLPPNGSGICSSYSLPPLPQPRTFLDSHEP